MGRAFRLDDVSCAICMESLFNKRDDLEEVEAIATPNCGHVFHEKCLLEWFKAQTRNYLTTMRDLHDREYSPSASDAPVECPTCRAECFANEDTGEPAIQRLYINLGGDSSQIGSSPSQPSRSFRTSTADKDAFMYARRARGLGEEFKGFNLQIGEDDLRGAIGRAEGLKEDMMSSKAMTGVKTYVGGLCIAINQLRDTLQSHPLLQTLESSIAELETRLRTTRKDMRELASITLPRRIKEEVDKERLKHEAKVKQYEYELKMVHQQANAEKTARSNLKKALEEAEQNYKRGLERSSRRAKELEEEKQELQKTLNERSKTLKLWQTKAESRKDLKTRNDELEQEVKRLKAKLAASSVSSAAITPPVASSPTKHDTSIEEVSPILDRPMHRRHANGPPADESLLVEMPTFSSSLPTSSPPRAGSGRNPTARIISCEIKPGKKRQTLSRSKYFLPDSPPLYLDLQHIEALSDEDVRVLVHGSLSPAPPSPVKKRKTNPFSTTREESEKRKLLKPVLGKENGDNMSRHPPSSVIDLTEDSPKSPCDIKRMSNGSRVYKTPSLGEKLGISDANGRPVKGLVAGARVKRRA